MLTYARGLAYTMVSHPRPSKTTKRAKPLPGTSIVGVRNHRLVNFYYCAFRLRMVCKEDMKMYTGSGQMSLRLVVSCSCYLHFGL
jgi:hypothetical protein